MNIKRFVLLTACGLITASGVLLSMKTPKENYFPRENTLFTQQEKLSSGYFDYLASLRNNRQTNTISVAEVQSAKVHASKMRKSNKSLDINWRFKGPDNVGGRTRALLIDQNDTNHILAGGVSGGLWESFNGAITWQPYDKDFKIVNVSSIAQGSDGTIYVGTGSTFERGTTNSKDVNSAFSGTGLYKLTGNGNSDLLKAPDDTLNFNGFNEWWAINDLAVDPNNPQRIFAATNTGLRESVDGGNSWVDPLTNFSPCQNVHISPNGKIIISFGNIIYYSLNNGTDYTTYTFPNSASSRIELAVAPSNTDIIYAAIARANNCLLGVYRSIDAGVSWSLIPNAPNYFGQLSCQGDYDNAIAVYPDDPGKIIVGGVSMFQWRQNSIDPAPPEGEWRSIATTSEFANNGSRNFRYVHADKHALVFHPTNSDKLFIASDGGVGFSSNMNSESPIYGQYNLGYNVTQFYDIAVGPNDLVTGGTQDNGTQLIGFDFNTGRSAIEVEGGDGFDTELFTINSSLGIASIYNGNITRIQGLGKTLQGSTPNTAGVYSGTLAALCSVNEGGLVAGCSPTFYTTIASWESFNHTLTNDSVIARVEISNQLPPLKAGNSISYSSKNNNWPLQGLLNEDLFPTDTVTNDDVFVVDKITGLAFNGTDTIITAFDTLIIDDGNTSMGGHGLITFKYRGQTSETKTYTYGQARTYQNIFHNRNMNGKAPLSVRIDTLNGTLGARTIRYQDPEVVFQYEKEFPDIVQSMVALMNVRGKTSPLERNVWLSKDLLKGGNVNEPRWIKIAGRNSTPTPTKLAQFSTSNVTITATFSVDGNYLFYGTDEGEIYRISGLNDIDLSQIPITADDEFTVLNTTSHRLIGDFGNRAVTGIAIDPQNPDNLLVTLGNYGQAEYVQRTTNATSNGTVVFTNISGVGTNALPDAPVYEAIIDRKDNNKVLIATELGVFATENAFETTVIGGEVDVRWTEENTGLGRVPVMSIKQMRFGSEVGAINEGKIYIGTHGRGIFETDQLVSINEVNLNDEDKASQRPELTIYPNPVVSNMNLELLLHSNDNVNVQLFTVRGRLVKELTFTNLKAGKNTLNLDLNNLSRGTYIIRSVQNNEAGTARFIKQ